MDFPDILDYLIVDELVSEEEYDAQRRRCEERGAPAPDDYDSDGSDDNISNSDH